MKGYHGIEKLETQINCSALPQCAITWKFTCVFLSGHHLTNRCFSPTKSHFDVFPCCIRLLLQVDSPSLFRASRAAGLQKLLFFLNRCFHGLKLSSHLLVEEVSCCCGVVCCFVVRGYLSLPTSSGGLKHPACFRKPGPNKTKSRNWFDKIVFGIRCCSTGKSQLG